MQAVLASLLLFAPSQTLTATTTHIPTTTTATLAAATISEESVEVRFDSNEAGLEIFRVSGRQEVATRSCWGEGVERAGGYSHGIHPCVPRTMQERTYQRICAAPCKATMEKGSIELAVAVNDEIVPIETPVELTSPRALDVQVEHRAGRRAIGWTLLIVGGGGGLGGLIAESAVLDRSDGKSVALAATLVATIASVVGGYVLASSEDRVALTDTAR
jgi:hypothetical protein